MWALFMQRLGFDDCWLMRPAYCWHRLRVDLELMTFSSRRGGVRGSFYNMTPLLQRRRVHCVAENSLSFLRACEAGDAVCFIFCAKQALRAQWRRGWTRAERRGQAFFLLDDVAPPA